MDYEDVEDFYQKEHLEWLEMHSVQMDQQTKTITEAINQNTLVIQKGTDEICALLKSLSHLLTQK